MKNITLLILLLIGLSANAQTFSVKVFLKYCARDMLDFEDRDLRIIQNDSVIVEDINTGGGRFKINGLTAGLYTFQFTNLFGRLVEQEVEITKDQEPILICVDEFDDSEESTLFESLKNNDTLTLLVSSRGCEHDDHDIMNFFYEDGQLIGELYIEEKLKKRKKLDSESLVYLSWVEKRIKYLPNNHVVCTTKNLYEFILNGNAQFSTYDTGCQWDGHYSLMIRDIFF